MEGDPDGLIRLGDARGNPYEGLDEVSGVGNPDRVIAYIGDRVKAAQRAALSETILVPGEMRTRTDEGARLVTEFFADSDPGDDTRKFIMPESGTSLHVGSAHFFSRFSYLELLGSLDPQIQEELQKKRERLGGMGTFHDEYARTLLDCPRGGTILEAGAGTDWKRMEALSSLASSKDGRFLAYDVVPAFAREAAQKMPGLTYLALPPDEEFLGKALEGNGSSVVCTLKDVISSIPYSALEEFWRIMKRAGTRRVVATQSLGISKTTNFVPSGFMEGSRLHQYFVSKIISSPNYQNLFGSIPDYVQFGAGFSFDQMIQYTELIVFEFLRWHFIRLARETAGFKGFETHLSENSEIIKDGQGYVDSFYPEYSELFRAGKFNTIEITPFCVKRGRNGGLARGEIRVSSMQMHILLTKDKIDKKKTPAGQVFATNDGVVPEKYMHISPDGHNDLLLSTNPFKLSDEEVTDFKRRFNVAEMRKLMLIGAIELVMTTWGTRGGIKHFDINQLAKREVADRIYWHLTKGRERV